MVLGFGATDEFDVAFELSIAGELAFTEGLMGTVESGTVGSVALALNKVFLDWLLPVSLV